MRENNKSPKFDEAGNVILTRKVENPKAEVKTPKKKVGRPRKKPIIIKTPKTPKAPKIVKIPKIDIIKELKEFDKTFGITDEQIVKYIRGKMK